VSAGIGQDGWREAAIAAGIRKSVKHVISKAKRRHRGVLLTSILPRMVLDVATGDSGIASQVTVMATISVKSIGAVGLARKQRWRRRRRLWWHET